MRKAILFMLTTMLMASCAEQQVFDAVTQDTPTQVSETESFDNLLAQAKWGDANAYLKLADYYMNGKNGTQPDFMATMSMLTMAQEYGTIHRPYDYFSQLPEDNSVRMTFEAMKSIDSSRKEKGMELADRLIGLGNVDGYALKAFACLEMEDSIEAVRLATLAAEQGSSFGKALQYVIPHARMQDMPDESIMIPLAETVPIFYCFMAEEYISDIPEHPENEAKAVRCYLKADEHGCLDKRGANWLLSHMEYGNVLPYSETDIQRLKQLGTYKNVPTIEYDNSDYDFGEYAADSISWDDTIEAAEEAIEAAEEAIKAAEEE